MSPAARALAAVMGAAIASSALGACAGGNQAVELTESWPANASTDYEEITAQWTRSGTLRAGLGEHFTEVAKAQATFLSPAWRAAYIEFLSRRKRMSQQARAELRAAEEKAAGEYHEIVLMLSTHDDRLNDLVKNKRSIWRVSLLNDRGQEVVASAIERERRPRETLRVLYPHLDDFARPYRLRFPRDLRVLGVGARHFALRLASAHGTIELRWQAP